mgnify:CR=1 FL=1
MLNLVADKKKRQIVARVGSKPVVIPAGVDVTLQPDNRVSVKGPKGILTENFHPEMVIQIEESNIVIKRFSDHPKVLALHGLTRALVNNMVVGVSEGYEKTLDLVGMGYRAQQAGLGVVLQLGFSHPVEVEPPDGINVSVESPTHIVVTGCDKQQVGQFSATLRKIRPPDAYKGKGIRYTGEVVRLKQGKTAGRP